VIANLPAKIKQKTETTKSLNAKIILTLFYYLFAVININTFGTWFRIKLAAIQIVPNITSRICSCDGI